MNRILVFFTMLTMVALVLIGCKSKEEQPTPQVTENRFACTAQGTEQQSILTRLAYAYRTFYDGEPRVSITAFQQTPNGLFEFELLELPMTTGPISVDQMVFTNVSYYSSTGSDVFSCSIFQGTLTSISPRTIGTFECWTWDSSASFISGQFDVAYAGAQSLSGSGALSFTTEDISLPGFRTDMALTYSSYAQHQQKLYLWGVAQFDTATVIFYVSGLPVSVGVDSLGAYYTGLPFAYYKVLTERNTERFQCQTGLCEITSLTPSTQGTFSGQFDPPGGQITDGQFDVPYAGSE